MSEYTPQEMAKVIKEAGYNLVAISTLACENTFYFDTIEESQRAWAYFNPRLRTDIEGWFYGIEEMEQNEKDYGNTGEIYYV